MKTSNLNTTPSDGKDTLEYIRTEKASVKQELKQCSDRIKESTHHIFSPPRATEGVGKWIHLFDRGMAIYEGVMFGMRIMRSVRHVFKKK